MEKTLTVRGGNENSQQFYAREYCQGWQVFKEAGIADAIKNGEVNLSPQDRSLSHPLVDETDPFLDIDSD